MASCTSGVVGPANPGVPVPMPGYVEIPSMSSRVSPASAMARSGRLHRQVEVTPAQAAPDLGLSDPRDDGPPLEWFLRPGRAHEAPPGDSDPTGVNSGIHTSS